MTGLIVNLRFIILLQVVTSVQEAMACHHPLLLHKALEAADAAIMGVQHQLNQRGHYTAQVPVLLLCTGQQGTH